MGVMRAGQRATAEVLNAIFGNVQGISVGMVVISPVANTITSEAVTGLTTQGDNFAAFVTANTTVPGIISEVSASGVSSSGLTVNVLRTNDTTTAIWWMHIGYSE